MFTCRKISTSCVFFMLRVLQCAAGRTWQLRRKKITSGPCVDQPQAQFQRTTSNQGHNSRRASGQDKPPGLLSGLINMARRKVHIYCMHNLLASLISLSNICWLLLFFFTLKGTKEKEMVDVEPPGIHLFFTAVMLLVCMCPLTARISDFIMPCCS